MIFCRSAVQDIEGDNYEDCMRFTDHVVCCETGVSSRHHKTDCWQRREEDIVRVHAAFYDFVKEWQSLENEQTAIFLYNPQRHAVLHFEPNKIYQIDENRLPEGAISIGFHFPMNTVDELEELVRSENEFKICQYLLEDNEKYVLKDDNCKGTNFEVEYELNQVRFCSNPLYEAVVQYGHYRNEDQLSWRLRVAYESSDYIYEAHDRIHSPVDQLAMDCNDQAIDLYVLGGQQLIEFAVKLPDETNAHFKKRRLRSLRNRNETNFHFIDRKLQLQQKYPPPYFSDEKIIMLGDLRANASIF
uniref:Uncharacterized protein n=1 Tax=Panagrolaimus sp. JU765 TaxID=591449 RepID=A0AC34R044_9BILA